MLPCNDDLRASLWLSDIPEKAAQHNNMHLSVWLDPLGYGYSTHTVSIQVWQFYSLTAFDMDYTSCIVI